MQLTAKQKAETGAFYTPKVWADKAVEYLREFIGEDFNNYIFWDCAGGEGALLEALPSNVRRIGTTLEADDVSILKSKGIEAYQFDFLDGDFHDLPFWNDIANNADKLVIFTNPPYLRLPASNQSFAKLHYKNNNAEELFIYRICKEISPKWLGIFTKSAIIQSAIQLWEDTNAVDCFAGGFATCSKQGWGLTGSFGILFSLFRFDIWQYELNRILDAYRDTDGLYYIYWTTELGDKSVTRTDLENLKQYIHKLKFYRPVKL